MPDEQLPNSNKADHLKPYHFKPGQSGNPGGRPKGALSLKRILRELLSANDGELGKAFVASQLAQAIRGNNPSAARELWSRVHGKEPIKVEMDEEDGEVRIITSGEPIEIIERRQEPEAE